MQMWMERKSTYVRFGRGDAARAHEADVLGARDLEVAVVEAVEDLAEHRGALVTCRRES